MGMDSWLYAKTKLKIDTKDTGVCSGLFPITVEHNGLVEIGYWRKAYDQHKLICDIASGTNNDEGRLLITKDEVDMILQEAKRIFTTHRFDDDGYDLTDDDPAFESDWGTWMSNSKWAELIRVFTDAKQILDEDPDAEIYYCMWN